MTQHYNLNQIFHKKIYLQFCNQKGSMTNSVQDQGLRKQNIKKFQSRVINRSVIDSYIYDKIADYMLQCCSAQAKPNTLSALSIIPLIIAICVITPGTSSGFFLLIPAIFIHQVLDIANKKQAYRLSEFNFNTYYLDHMYDSVSCVIIVYLISSALQLENEAIFSCAFFFGILPFFTHHLAMYSSGYLTFLIISPATEGLFAFQILFFICGFIPNLLQTEITASIKIYEIVVCLCSIWLIIFLVDDLRTISKIKTTLQIDNGSVDKVPIKNVLIVCIIGYIMMEIAIVQTHMLRDSVYFHFMFFLFSVLSSLTISGLLLAYGFGIKYKQIELHMLIVFGAVVIVYSICGFSSLSQSAQILMGQTVMGGILVLEVVNFFYTILRNLKTINKILREDY